MRLDLFSRLFNDKKDHSNVKEFINDLGNSLSKNITENNLERQLRNEISLLEKIQFDKRVTTNYRDKMHIERNNILNNYAETNFEDEEIYFVYDKSSSKEDSYNMCICQEGRSHEIIEINESELPMGAGVDSVLRIKDGKYIIDKKATDEICEKVQDMINDLLKEQEKELNEKHIENHLYEVIEKSEYIVLLMDSSIDNGDCFEEINFTEENLSKATEGALFKYTNGEYVLYDEIQK